MATTKTPVEAKERRSKVRLTGNAEAVLKARYLIKDENGEVTETAEELFQRVAAAVATAKPIVKSPPTTPPASIKTAAPTIPATD